MTDGATLQEIFEALEKAHPDLTAGQQPLGSGFFGIVITSKDIPEAAVPTVTKILFRNSYDETQALQKDLDNETQVMRLLDGAQLGDAQVPRLVGAAQVLEDSEYFAAYTMTKVPGVTARWPSWAVRDEEASAEHARYYREAGKLLAHFHAAAAKFPVSEAATLHKQGWCNEVETLDGLDAATNAELAAADRYLQAHKTPGIVHGDFHGGNILVDETGRITGLIDFSRTGPGSNILLDFPESARLPEGCADQFREGYEETSGKKIDPYLVMMSEISAQVNCLKIVWPDQKKREEALTALRRNLDRVRPVTGIAAMGQSAS